MAFQRHKWVLAGSTCEAVGAAAPPAAASSGCVVGIASAAASSSSMSSSSSSSSCGKPSGIVGGVQNALKAWF